ncbi:hypothetical protein D9M70_642150 [compost metagenome]
MVHGGGGDRRVAEPDRLVAPAAGLGRGIQGTAEQRPLHAELMPLGILEIGGDVPPLDAKTFMKAMVGGETEHPPRHNRRERDSLVAEAGKALLRWR